MAEYNLTQTGAQVQQLLDTVAAGYIYMGTADLTTTPDTTNPNVCYLLKAVGTYTNFGNVTHTSGITLAMWNGTAWSAQNVPSAAVVLTDATPTEGSTNPVQSGGVYDAMQERVPDIFSAETQSAKHYEQYTRELYTILPDNRDYFGYYNNRIWLCTRSAGDTQVLAYSDLVSNLTNGEPIELRVMQTNDSVNFPIGKVVGYAVISDISAFCQVVKTGGDDLINYDVASNITYSPIIMSYLDIQENLQEVHDKLPLIYSANREDTKHYEKYLLELYTTLPNAKDYFKYYSNRLYLAKGQAPLVLAYSDEVSTLVDGQPIKLKVYYTNDATNYPIGMVVGYAVISDISAFCQVTGQGGDQLINYSVASNISYSPRIQAYLREQAETDLKICLPDNLTAVVGDTLQLFYRGFVFTPLPAKYNIVVSCSKGEQYPRYFEYTPTAGDVGTTTFKIQVKDDNRIVIAEKSCTLTTKAKASSPASNKNILCFGASTTEGGQWPHEADRRLTGSGGTPTADGLTNITFCGSMTKEGTGYFGAGGWGWVSYTTNNLKAYRFQVSGVGSLSRGAKYTNNGNTFTIAEINVTSGSGSILCSVSSLTPAPLSSGTLTRTSGTGDATITYSSVAEDTSNPLWDTANNKMSFVPYANNYCNGQIDIVYCWLGYNEITSGQTDFTTIISYVQTFADTLHTEFPNAKLKILGEGLPSFRGGMGANYGATGTGWADGYGIELSSFNLSDAYQTFANQSAYSGFVEFVNVATQFDVEYNMLHTEKAVNTRNTSVTEWMDTNGVHPANAGYMQVADVVYRNIMKELQ